MALGIGPHQPKAGWATRWLKQALQLALASPAGLLIMLVALIVVGGAQGTLRGLGMTSFGHHMTQAILASALLPAAIMVVNQIMRADGRGSISLAEIMELSRRMVPPALAALGLISLVGWLMPDPPRMALGGQSDLSTFLRGGVALWVLAEMTCCMLNPFWLGSSTALQLGISEALTAHNALLMKHRLIWAVAVVAIVWVSGPLMNLPVEILLPLLYIRICWQYVAAREILGGIDDNGIEEKAAAPSLA